MNQRSKVNKTTNTKLSRVELKSRSSPDEIFTNLGHILSVELFAECFDSLDGSKAVGMDRVTKEDYGNNLEDNLWELLFKIRNGSYYPKPTRTVEIPKNDGSMRQLSIACIEDKIVQESVRRILEAIYEPHFLDCSHGFRPGKNCHGALVNLDQNLMDHSTGAVLDVDIEKCFPNIPHEPLIKILENKIGDKSFLYLIIKLIRCANLNSQGQVVENSCGVPQGSILSPLLANIYLHECVDKWFMKINAIDFNNECKLVRYADDMVFTTESTAKAEKLKRSLGERLGIFGLKLHATKTKVTLNGKKSAEYLRKRGKKSPALSFLGFIHVWGRSWRRDTKTMFWRIKRRTCPVRFRAKLKMISIHFRKNMHRKDFLEYAKRIVNGYLEYFAINDNTKRLSQFVHEVKKIMFKNLNRRSQKRSLSWERFSEILNKIDFPKVVIRHNLFFNSSAFGRYK